jgi:Flp pilus assembly pilin Flp
LQEVNISQALVNIAQAPGAPVDTSSTEHGGHGTTLVIRKSSERRELMIELLLNSIQRDEDGQTMAEYAVVLAVITVVIIGALTALAGGIGNALDSVTSVLS